jgi:hypothetical protein
MTDFSNLHADILQPHAEFDKWLIATFSISFDGLVGVLSEPHYTESDPLRTAGGSEDHWAFEFPSRMRISIIFRRPYEEASILADPPEVKVVLKTLQPLLLNRKVRILDPPILLK